MKYQTYSKQIVHDRLSALMAENRYLAPEEIDDSYLPEILIEGCWVNLRTNTPEMLPTGTIVLDVETTDQTKTLALASAYHLESEDLFYFINPLGNKEPLLDVADGSLVVAHRAAFENSFIRQNYVSNRPSYRSFCTYAYAATRLHPLKPSLYRAMSFLPMFGESSDCSLADLFFLATNKYLDKTDVSMFIDSTGDEWRKEDWEICIERGLYRHYAEGKTFKTRFAIPAELLKFKEWKYPALPKLKDQKIEELNSILNNESLDRTEEEEHAVKLRRHKLERQLKITDPFTYENVLLSEAHYCQKLKEAFNQTINPVRRGLLYNLRDVLATVQILPLVLKQVSEISEEAFTGIQIRLQPMYALDPDFENQLTKIESVWAEKKEKLQKSAEVNVRTHRIVGGSWDGQDWSLLKNGRVEWYQDSKIGYTKTLNAIASQIHWKENPLKRILAHPPVLLKSGQWCFPTMKTTAQEMENPATLDMEKQKKYWAYEKNPRGDLSYEERLASMDEFSCLPLENPESTELKKFKPVLNFYSKALLKYWQNGEFTSTSPEIQAALPVYISTSYWTSIRKRMLGQKTVPISAGVKFTAPRPSVHGAVSGRSVDALFLVLAKLDKSKIGSEMGGMLVAPPGYAMVGWDLDSCQARIAGVIADAWYAKRQGLDQVTIGSTEISRAIFFGDKKNRTSLAHVLGDKYLGFDLSIPAMADKSYSLGKNAQFALIFGVGADKLAKMLNVSSEIAEKLVKGWKGRKDPLNPSQWVGGTASDLINAQQALASRCYPSAISASKWDWHNDVLGVVSAEKLPHVLNPKNSGKDYITTKYNAFIQNGDVAMLNHALHWLDKHCEHLDYRYCSSIHDYFAFFVKEDHVSEFVEAAKAGHKDCYEKFFKLWNVDTRSVPNNVWYPSTIDVGKRLVKELKDELAINSQTVSFNGYSANLWDDASIDSEELVELDEGVD